MRSAKRTKRSRRVATAVASRRTGKGRLRLPFHGQEILGNFPRPFVAATFAMTVDGKITTRSFSPIDFTSREDKRHLLRQRAAGDAVLIGHSTLKHDNVRLGLPGTELCNERIARGQRP